MVKQLTTKVDDLVYERFRLKAQSETGPDGKAYTPAGKLRSLVHSDLDGAKPALETEQGEGGKPDLFFTKANSEKLDVLLEQTALIEQTLLTFRAKLRADLYSFFSVLVCNQSLRPEGVPDKEELEAFLDQVYLASIERVELMQPGEMP